MKYYLSILIFLLAFSPLGAQGLKGGKKIVRVIGVATLQVEPNEVSFNVGVETESSKIKDAQQENNQKMNLLKGILEKYKVPKENINTIDYSIQPVYNYKDGKSEWRAYKVAHRWRVKVTDNEQASLLIDELGANATTVQEVQFSIKNTEQYSQKAIKLAIANARLKASFIAKEIGLKVKSVLLVEDLTGGRPSLRPNYNRAMMMADEGIPMQGGTVGIEGRVLMVFEMVL